MSTIKVLLVDDHAEDRRALRSTLFTSGYAVIEARTGEEALEEYRAEGDLDLILLKLRVPGSLEACRKIRKISTVPILAISATRNQEEKLQAFDAGADDHSYEAIRN